MRASFPNFVKIFGNRFKKMSGILANGIDELEEEVSAIESSLLGRGRDDIGGKITALQEAVGGMTGGWGDITVTSDWSTESNVLGDIVTSLGLGKPGGISATLVLVLWKGLSDPDDYATFEISSSGGEWGNGFRSNPSNGNTVKIIGASYMSGAF